MRPRDVSKALSALIPTRRPVYLWGPPGGGKSSVVKQAADALKVKLVDVRATLLDPVDLRGLPKVTEDRAEWCPPAFLPRTGDGVLFLDELAQAPPLVQAACLQLVLDRKVGEYELPPGWAVVAASNRQDDRAGTHRLITPLLNRFVHLDLDVDPGDWQAWAGASGVAPEVRAFLQYRPALLAPLDPVASPRAFPTPRSWQFVSDVLTGTPADLLHRVVAGCVGDGPAAEFVGFLQLYRELPDLDALGKQPETTAVPREPAVLYALVGAIAEKCRADAAPVHGLVQYALRLPDEFALLALRDVLAVKPALASLSVVQQWIARARTKGLFLAA
ncbi:AAA family ATPase [Limnoglobus roseus]|uniref:ATP-binding protein n=1 Tax=Limnoglobus roseus TaxID=2598579 RepID=A0A5C1AFQ4_9BACT|nr:MoxR family ATPase [Limnoglobus roseus]QEL17650.1 ATP-binding protein [Limnoglobus roseus]